ncbi:MAG: 4-aminobutyrate transaminase [Firmicutes bacterium]|nr:4-aminobutyrate transaminase [Bacillota bacterium]
MANLGKSLPEAVTSIPGPKSRRLMKLREENCPAGLSHGCPVFIDRGEGAMFQDIDGNVFLDFAGGLGVLNLGYSNPEVIETVKEQTEKYFHAMINTVQYESYIRLAEKLNSIVPGNFPKKTFFINSGGEADENAIKIARRYTGRSEVVVFTGAFHGRTNMTMAMTSKVKPYKYGFGPLASGFHRAEFPYIYRRPAAVPGENAMEYFLEKLNSFFLETVSMDEVAAIIIEPVIGEGGFVAAPIEYVRELRRICDEHGIVLVADEVQTGFCRTGRMFATEYWAEEGIYPDIVTSAKSIAAGLPLSAVTGKAEIMDAVQAGGIGGTYGGNPLAAVAALKVIEIMERDDYAAKALNIERVTRKKVAKMAKKYRIIGDFRSLGAMMAIEFVRDRVTKEPADAETKAIIKECNRNGLIVLDAGIRGNVIRLLMPLCITYEQLNAGLDIIENSVEKISSELEGEKEETA